MNFFVLCSLLTVCSAGFAGYDEEHWQTASKFLLEGYNPQVQPCNNFQQYACGNWKDKSTNEVLKVNLAKYLDGIKAAKKVDEHNKATPNYKKSVKYFLKYCGEQSNSTTIADVYREIADILGSPPLFNKSAKNEFLNKNVWFLMGYVQRNFPSSSTLFKVTIQPAALTPDEHIAILFFIPNYHVINFIRNQTLTEQVLKMAKYLNVDVSEKELHQKIANMVKLEIGLAQYLNRPLSVGYTRSVKNLKLTNRLNVEKVITVAQLEQRYPNISWTDYFHGLFTPEQWKHFDPRETYVLLEDVHANLFIKINDLLQQTDNETIFNYAFYTVLSDSLRQLKDINQCIMYAFDCFGTALTRMIFEDQGNDLLEWRADMQLIIETVFTAARYLFAASDWLTDSEKIKLITKINQMTYFPAVPDWIMNDTEVNRRTLEVDEKLSVTRNVLNILKGNFERYLNMVVNIDDPGMDSEPVLETNANYMNLHILMYIGYALPPWYHPKYPLAVKYGNIGYVVGHELFHGFDVGRIEERPHYVKSWLNDCTMQQYYQKVKCLKKQYSSICSSGQKKCLSGQKTITENMGDVDGVKVAYMAYKFATMTAGVDNPLPGLTNLTGDQLFFLTIGRIHCATMADLEGWFRERDVHAPELARLEMPLKNFDAFARAFKCPSGSRYDAAHSCPMWGTYTGIRGIEF